MITRVISERGRTYESMGALGPVDQRIKTIACLTSIESQRAVQGFEADKSPTSSCKYAPE